MWTVGVESDEIRARHRQTCVGRVDSDSSRSSAEGDKSLQEHCLARIVSKQLDGFGCRVDYGTKIITVWEKHQHFQASALDKSAVPKDASRS
jgi:hypothetical protein